MVAVSTHRVTMPKRISNILSRKAVRVLPMKPIIIFAVLCQALASCGDAIREQLIACGGDKILIIDAQASDGADVSVVWRWQVSEAASQLPEAYQKYLVPLDECKPVDEGKNVLAASSSGGVVLIERATKKCLFYAYAPMAHSADVLPDGRIAVALSTHPKGNSIELYDRKQPGQVLFKDSLHSGHGAVWNAKRQRLYALGFDELREYSLADWATPSPSLKLERKWTIPGKGGHDLSPVSDDELLVSEHSGVHSFDIPSETFKAFEPLKHAENVKSVNYIKERNRLVYTQANGEDWWTFDIHLKNPDKTLHISNIKLYKVRLITN